MLARLLPIPIHVASSVSILFFGVPGHLSVAVAAAAGSCERIGGRKGLLVAVDVGYIGSSGVHVKSVQVQRFAASVGQFCQNLSSSS